MIIKIHDVVEKFDRVDGEVMCKTHNTTLVGKYVFFETIFTCNVCSVKTFKNIKYNVWSDLLKPYNRHACSYYYMKP